MEDNVQEEFAGLLARLIPHDGSRNFFGSVGGFRSSQPTAPTYVVYDPLLCVIAQGSKQVLLGNDRYIYDPTHCVVNTAALPVAFQITDATRDHPYLSIFIHLDLALVRSVIVEAGLREPDTQRPTRAISAGQIDRPLLDSVIRLARLFDTPQDTQDTSYLAPLLLREIIYRVLVGEQGARLYQSAFISGQTRYVLSAIEWMRKNFDKPLRIETLARECGLSTSGLHHYFKSVTAMSPLQFQKQLRLQEARRLMIDEGMDAAGAGFRVGYEDASYFSRDYKRFFGKPPFRDTLQLRAPIRW